MKEKGLIHQRKPRDLRSALIVRELRRSDHLLSFPGTIEYQLAYPWKTRHAYLIRWITFASLIALERISELIFAQVHTFEEGRVIDVISDSKAVYRKRRRSHEEQVNCREGERERTKMRNESSMFIMMKLVSELNTSSAKTIKEIRVE